MIIKKYKIFLSKFFSFYSGRNIIPMARFIIYGTTYWQIEAIYNTLETKLLK